MKFYENYKPEPQWDYITITDNRGLYEGKTEINHII